MDEGRLDRIEEKLDRVVETLQLLARIDERQDAFDQRLSRHELRLDLIERATQENTERLATAAGRGLLIERAAWILFAAAVGSASYFL